MMQGDEVRASDGLSEVEQESGERKSGLVFASEQIWTPPNYPLGCRNGTFFFSHAATSTWKTCELQCGLFLFKIHVLWSLDCTYPPWEIAVVALLRSLLSLSLGLP